MMPRRGGPWGRRHDKSTPMPPTDTTRRYSASPLLLQAQADRHHVRAARQRLRREAQRLRQP